MIIKVIDTCTYMGNLKRSFFWLHVLCLFKRANSEFGIELLFFLSFLCLFIQVFCHFKELLWSAQHIPVTQK